MRSVLPSEQPAFKCHGCQVIKTADQFTWGKSGAKRDSLCRPCRSRYGAEHYRANRARYIERANALSKRLARERTQYLIADFEVHPCVDCGEDDPVVLDFDHLGDKAFSIGHALKSYKWQRILEEIEKCEVVCANCPPQKDGHSWRPPANPAHGLETRKRVTGLEPVLGAWKAPVQPVTLHPRIRRRV